MKMNKKILPQYSSPSSPHTILQMKKRKNNSNIIIDRDCFYQVKNDKNMLIFLEGISEIFGRAPILVGSRGCIGNDNINNDHDAYSKGLTDYDFILPYDKDRVINYIQQLDDLSYIRQWSASEDMSKYVDSECCKILKITLDDGRNIDIVFRKDVDFYISCLEMVTVGFYKDFLWKSSDTFLPSGIAKDDRKQYITKRFEDLYAIKRRLDRE